MRHGITKSVSLKAPSSSPITEIVDNSAVGVLKIQQSSTTFANNIVEILSATAITTAHNMIILHNLNLGGDVLTVDQDGDISREAFNFVVAAVDIEVSGPDWLQ